MECNVDQTRDYIQVHGKDCINSVLKSHDLLVPDINEKTDPKEPMTPIMIKQVKTEKEIKT